MKGPKKDSPREKPSPKQPETEKLKDLDIRVEESKDIKAGATLRRATTST